MTGMATLEARVARRRRAFASSVVVAAATTVVTGCAHALGGGTAPDALLLVTALVATLLVLAPVLGSRASPIRRVAAVAIAQLLQHGLYSLPDTSAAIANHQHGASTELGSFAVAHAHAAMPLAHLGAGLVTLWLLRAAPRAVAAVQGAVSLRLIAATLDWAPPPARRRATVTASRPAPRGGLEVLRDALERRGPPLLVG